MSIIQQALSDQQGTNSRLEQQLSSTDERTSELKTLINGADGNSGLLSRLASLESKLETSSEDITRLQKSFEETRHLVLKVALLIGAGASAGTAGIQKLLAVLGG